MPANDPKDLRPPVKYKPRPVARQLSRAEIKAAADRAEARSAQVANDPPNSLRGKGPAATRMIEGGTPSIRPARQRLLAPPPKNAATGGVDGEAIAEKQFSTAVAALQEVGTLSGLRIASRASAWTSLRTGATKS